ncbi:MAG: hypothetical protein AAFX44_00615 [Pseudomonadota bacterium]
MSDRRTANIVAFPARRTNRLATCPHCGTLTETRRVGRLLWAYCEEHEARWVVRDFGAPPPAESRRDVERALTLLARFAEVGA